jgi:hypothetical protein
MHAGMRAENWAVTGRGRNDLLWRRRVGSEEVVGELGKRRADPNHRQRCKDDCEMDVHSRLGLAMQPELFIRRSYCVFVCAKFPGPKSPLTLFTVRLAGAGVVLSPAALS